eukprot:6210489-Pleurochrysis_carterae.AAC.4
MADVDHPGRQPSFIAPPSEQVRRRLPSHRAAHLALLLAALIFCGWNIISAQCLDSGVDALAFSAARELFATPILWVWAVLAEGPLQFPRRIDLLSLVALGLLLAGFQLCFAFGIQMTDAQSAALFQCIEPTTAAFLARLLRTERLSALKLISALLAGLGVALIELNHSNSGKHKTAHASDSSLKRLIGCALLFGQGMGIAGYCILQGQLLKKPFTKKVSNSSLACDGPQPVGASQNTRAAEYGPITLIAYAYFGSFVVTFCAAALLTVWHGERKPPISAASMHALLQPLSLMTIAYAVVFTSCFGYTLRAWANMRLDASALVLYNAAQPPLTLLLSLALGLAPSFGFAEAAGTMLVIAAMVLAAQSDVIGEATNRCYHAMQSRATAPMGLRHHSSTDDERGETGSANLLRRD